MRGRVPAQLWSVASVHPARYARDNYAPAGLLARDLGLPPTCPPSRINDDIRCAALIIPFLSG